MQFQVKKLTREELPAALQERLFRAGRVLKAGGRQPVSKESLLVWHAPEVECIAKGKVKKPYEFGCKVSLVTNINRAKGGHFILSARALHGRPYDRHTLNSTVENISQIIGAIPSKIYVDKGYKGHDYPNKADVFKSGQKLGVIGRIKRELRRRNAI